jgi:hypothetical protein
MTATPMPAGFCRSVSVCILLERCGVPAALAPSMLNEFSRWAEAREVRFGDWSYALQMYLTIRRIASGCVALPGCNDPNGGPK